MGRKKGGTNKPKDVPIGYTVEGIVRDGIPKEDDSIIFAKEGEENIAPPRREIINLSTPDQSGNSITTEELNKRNEDFQKHIQQSNKIMSETKIPAPANISINELAENPVNHLTFHSSGGADVCDVEAEPNTPPSLAFKRNRFGLLYDGKYEFNEDGSVNYRKLVKSEFLVPNRTNFTSKNKEVPRTIEGLEDRDLLVLLAGFKEVAQIRGYTSVDHQIMSCSPEYVCLKTTICWIPNYETNNKSVCFSSIADASLSNTNGFGKLYLSSIAENRGFVRAVRNFLKIHVLSADEIGATEAPSTGGESISSPTDPNNVLNNILKQHKISFEKFRAGMIEEGVKDADAWSSLSDVPKEKTFFIISKVQERIEKKKNESK